MLSFLSVSSQVLKKIRNASHLNLLGIHHPIRGEEKLSKCLLRSENIIVEIIGFEDKNSSCIM